MNEYDCHYYDRAGRARVFSTYARDIAHARQQTEELVGSQLSRITGLVRVGPFDW